MTDKILIHELVLYTHLGVTEDERKEPQALFADIELIADLHKSGESDRIEDTIDYRDVCRDARAIGSRTFNTVESLAHKIATHLRENYPVQKASVLIKKRGALARAAQHAAVYVER